MSLVGLSMLATVSFPQGHSTGLIVTAAGLILQGTYLFKSGSIFSKETCEKDSSGGDD